MLTFSRFPSLVPIGLVLVGATGSALVTTGRTTADERESSPSSAYHRMVMMKGAWLFDRNCAFCHEKDGRGSVGPNLTDWYFIHGPSRENLREVIQNGVPDKGMPTWKSILKGTDLRLIEQYVWSLRGKDLQGKPPEGELAPDHAPESGDGVAG